MNNNIKLHGLPNIGNTCYLNACIQTLKHIPVLMYELIYPRDKIKIFAIFGSAAPTITLMLALLIMFIIIFIPICGGLLSFFSIIKAIVYIILNCDDDDDFLFLILKIINYIFGKNFGESN